ncbi:MAG TPA: hypothetical protein PLS73_00505 [Saprospiraceae bacterium]|nr:hypothetical protein [Saprospiraceae bacterium]
MRTILIILLFLNFIPLKLNAQSNKINIGYSFSYGLFDYNIINNDSYQRSLEHKVKFTIKDKMYVCSGIELRKQISSNLNLNTGLQIAFFRSTQFAKGALFASDQSTKCLFNDSCSSFQLKLYDFLFQIPTNVEIPFNKRVELILGLNHYLLIYSYYDYLINESGFNIISNKGSGRNYSEFPSRYNLSIHASIGYNLIDNLKLIAFYEYFIRDHILAAPSINVNLRNIGLKIIYKPKTFDHNTIIATN